MQLVNDRWHNYDLGEARRAAIKDGKIQFNEEKGQEFPWIININQQIEYIRTHRLELSPKLRVTYPSGRCGVLRFITKEYTLEFAEKHILKHGRENAEKILSSTETGSLYFHIIYHYGTFDNLAKKIDKQVV